MLPWRTEALPRSLSRAGILKPQAKAGPGILPAAEGVHRGVGCHHPPQFKRKVEVPAKPGDSPLVTFPSLMQQAAIYLRKTGLPSGTFVWFLWLIMGAHLPLCHFLQIKQFLRKGTNSLKYIVWSGG